VEDMSRDKCFVFFSFSCHTFYVLYPFVTYLVTLSPSFMKKMGVGYTRRTLAIQLTNVSSSHQLCKNVTSKIFKIFIFCIVFIFICSGSHGSEHGKRTHPTDGV
jgi:hypothetical protein